MIYKSHSAKSIPETMLLGRVGVLFLSECAVLLAMNIDSPLYYEVGVVDSAGPYQPDLQLVTKSRGQCVGGSAMWPYLSCIIAIHAAVLIYGNYLVCIFTATRTKSFWPCITFTFGLFPDGGTDALRSVPSEFNEGKYIGFSLANTMQTTMITLLLSFMVHDDPTLWFILRWIAVYIPSLVTLSLMFVPKIVMIHFPAVGRDMAVEAVVELQKQERRVGSKRASRPYRPYLRTPRPVMSYSPTSLVHAHARLPATSYHLCHVFAAR